MVRTRFTLNPGSMNIQLANIRNLVFSFLYARRQDGQLCLRAEDIDADNRSTSDNLNAILGSLKWLGLSWNEPVLKTGERLAVYGSLAKELLKEGRAYPCYCTPEEIEARKKARATEGLPQHYDGKCRHLTSAQIKTYEAEGRKPSLRFMVYEDGFDFTDMLKGKIAIPSGTIGDFIILRSNGTPIGLFAEAADDIEAGITHVFKTEEPLSGLARQLMVYKALGQSAPLIAHLPAITDSDGRKLSRQSPGVKGQNLDELRTMGYFPEALMNYFALLGWSNPDGREILGTAELTSLFDPEKKPENTAVFDQGKLDWIARHFILNEDKERLYEKALPFLPDAGSAAPDFMRGVVELAKGYCACLSDIKDHVLYFIRDDYPFSGEAESALKRKEAGIILKAFREWAAADNREMDENIFGEMIGAVSRKTDIRGRGLFTVLRAALTGRMDGPEIYYLIPVIGKERTLGRIDRALRIQD